MAIEGAVDRGAVAKIADQGASDAVFVGSGQRGGFTRAIFGSVATYVTAHTRTTVIIVH